MKFYRIFLFFLISLLSRSLFANLTISEQLAQLEQQQQATIGVYLLDTETNQAFGYRENERFAYASTFKALLAGQILQRFCQAELAKIVPYSKVDLLDYSPITQQFVEQGMSLQALAEATVRTSDNTAANLLLKALGGVSAYQQGLEQIGDHFSVASRMEPELNQAHPNDLRDTSSPKQMAINLKKYALDLTLPAEKQAMLQHWLTDNRTGDPLIRAAVPTTWQVLDKSGAGKYGTRNDIAIIYLPQRKPLVLAIMSKKASPNAEWQNQTIAESAKIVLSQWFKD